MPAIAVEEYGSGAEQTQGADMNYRTLGKAGRRVSILGFGAMRLPTRGNDSDVDAELAVGMLRHAVDKGVNYIDSAYVYHGGNSERVVGAAMRDGYRERVNLATKMPVWKVDKTADFDRLFGEQLERLQTDHIEFYLFHCLQKRAWEKMKGLGILEWAEKARAAGRIGEFGFSFHDSYEVFREIIDCYDWSFCQIQYNLVNETVQAGTRGLRYAAARGVSVVIMEPLFGGTVANPPPPVKAVWESAGRNPVDLALRWLWDKPEISVVLSGMSNMEQTRQNIDIASRGEGAWLDEADRKVILAVQAAYRNLSPIPCTKCRYCMPCPHGLDIPLNFELYNNLAVFQGNSAQLCRALYNGQPESQKASACTKCRACEEKCPQQIEISAKMDAVARCFA